MGLAPLTIDAASKSIKIGAIFSQTGPASFLGAPEVMTARMLVSCAAAETIVKPLAKYVFRRRKRIARLSFGSARP
jgi:hypothetical protein